MLQHKFAFAASIAVLSAAVPFAGHAQVVNTAGTWSNVPVPTNAGVAFWDHSSLDGTACNVGHFLLYAAGSGFGACNNQKPTDAFVQANAGRLGTNANGPNGSYLSHTNFSFKAGQYHLEFLGGVATYGPTSTPLPQELSIFTNGLGGPVFQQRLYAVGSYPNALTTSFDVYMGADWFLGAHHVQSANLWDYTTNTGSDHGWALFSSQSANNQPGHNRDVLWVAFGDVEAGDQDYNDLILQVTAVPEPGSIVLFGAGFAALAFVGRRRLGRRTT